MPRFKGRVGQPGQIRINREQVEEFKQQLNEGFADVVAEVDIGFSETIADPNAFVDQGFIDQDIIDTGRFQDSQQKDVQGSKITWIWAPVDPDTGEHYAAQLYSGFSYNGKYIPGRHWPERTLQRIDPVESLASALRSRGIRVRVTRNNVGRLDA